MVKNMSKGSSREETSKLENIVMKSQEKYKKIEIPDELDSVIDRAIESVIKKKIKWYKPMAAVVASLLVLVLCINVSPVFASYVERIPGFERLVKIVRFDKGLKQAVDNGFAQKIDKSSESEGVIFTVNDIILDQKNIILTYDLKTKDLYNNLTLEEFKLKNIITGQRITNYSHEPIYDEQYSKVNGGIIRIQYDNDKNSIPKQLVIEVTSISGLSKDDDGKQRKTISGTWNISFNINKEKLKEATPKNLLLENKIVVVDDMKFTIDAVNAYATNMDVHITLDSNNPYKFVDFKNIYMEDEEGTKYRFKGSSYESQYEYTFHFISNYYATSKHLQLKCDGIYIMPKEKQYIEVDLRNKKIIDDSGFHLEYLFNKSNLVNYKEKTYDLQLGIKIVDEKMLTNKDHSRPLEVNGNVYDNNGNSYLIDTVSWSEQTEIITNKKYGVLTYEFPNIKSVPDILKIEIISVYTNSTKYFDAKIN
jgi:hypothetical protein